MFDLVDFGGTYISLSSIHAVIDEMEDNKPTGAVFIEYGPHGARAGFEGSAKDVMRVIAEWQRDNAPRAAGQPLLASA
ncbi:hypothetical protein [Arthrobacter sp. Y81]|uniref:hypothetical protein n=1 Tax=Arthrobacter sp. Y81 TaxID=2058897 RepID=UPI000CE2D4EA|nr:hypothetical protein [Arthrobacter sp. Y81]